MREENRLPATSPLIQPDPRKTTTGSGGSVVETSVRIFSRPDFKTLLGRSRQGLPRTLCSPLKHERERRSKVLPPALCLVVKPKG